MKRKINIPPGQINCVLEKSHWDPNTQDWVYECILKYRSPRMARIKLKGRIVHYGVTLVRKGYVEYIEVFDRPGGDVYKQGLKHNKKHPETIHLIDTDTDNPYILVHRGYLKGKGKNKGKIDRWLYREAKDETEIKYGK